MGRFGPHRSVDCQELWRASGDDFKALTNAFSRLQGGQDARRNLRVLESRPDGLQPYGRIAVPQRPQSSFASRVTASALGRSITAAGTAPAQAVGQAVG